MVKEEYTMKRLMLFMLAFVLACPVPGMAQEAAAPAVITLPEKQIVCSQCLYQGRVWMLSGTGEMYAWSPEEGLQPEQAAVPRGYGQWLVAQGDVLYCMDTTRFVLRPLRDANGAVKDAAPLTLEPVEFTDPADDYTMPQQMLLRDDTLYILYRPQSLRGYGTRLAAWDITTGKQKEVAPPRHLQAIAAHPNGLLGMVMDAEKYAMTGDKALARPALVLFGAGSEQEISRLQQPVEPHIATLAVNSQGDVLYVSDSKIYRHTPGGDEQLAAYLSNAWFMEGSGDWLVPVGEQVSVLAMDTVTVVSAVQGVSAQPLTLYGLQNRDNAHFKALEQLPGVPVNYIDSSWGDDTLLAQLLASSAGALDVLYVDSRMADTRRLVDKGYCLDISESPIIREHVARCYPFLQAEAVRGEGIFLVPVCLDAGVLQTKPERFAKLELDAPRTFQDFCGFLQHWADEAPDSAILPIPWSRPLRAVQQEALMTAHAALARQGEPFSFEAPLVRELLSMTEGLNLQALEWDSEDYSKYHQPNMMQKTNLSLSYLTMSAMDDPDDRAELLALAPDERTPPGFPLQVGWLAVYGKPGREQDAIRYIEGYITALSKETRIMLYPDENTPLQPQGIEDAIQRLTAEVAGLEKQLETAQGEARATLTSQLADKRDILSSQIEQRYYVSPEVIAQYRDVMQHALIENRDMHLILTGSEFTSLMARWQQGQMPLDQYLREAEGKLRLMRLEGQ